MSPLDRRALDVVVARFTEICGHPPTGVWMAPGRVNLIGEHTDYNQGFVLPFALPNAVLVAVSPRSDARYRVSSPTFGTVELKVERAVRDDWGRYPEAAIRAVKSHGIEPPGMDLVIESDVPVGAGLSSSAALLCAIILAATDLAASPLTPQQVALLAQRAEVDWVGVPVGIMDQMASMCSTEDHALFLDCRSMDHELVPLDRFSHSAPLAMLIVDTKVRRSLVEGKYASRRRSCEEVAAYFGVPALRDVTTDMLEMVGGGLDETHLKRARHVVTENARVLQAVQVLRGAGLAGIGDLLSESHRSLSADYDVSVPELDLAVVSAEAAGALGARMTGAGFGGCALVLVPEDSIDQVTTAMERAFAKRGFDRPSVFEAWPSPGAHRMI